MNNVILAGRLTKDPEIVTINTTGGPKLKAVFALAVQRNYKNAQGQYESDYIRCEAWGKTGEVITKYLKKGYPAVVTGSWRTSQYTDKDGKTVFASSLWVDHFEFSIQNPKQAQPQVYVQQPQMPQAYVQPQPYVQPVPQPQRPQVTAGYQPVIDPLIRF